MPHCVFEISTKLGECVDLDAFLDDAFTTMLELGEFGEADIKVRLSLVDHYCVGKTEAGFVHCTVFMLDGRCLDLKKKLSLDLLECSKSWFGDEFASLTVDVRDIGRDCYSKCFVEANL